MEAQFQSLIKAPKAMGFYWAFFEIIRPKIRVRARTEGEVKFFNDVGDFVAHYV